MRSPASLAAAGALLVIALGAVVIASQSRRHVIDTNYVGANSFVAEVPGGAEICQPGERIPAGTGRVEMRIGTFGPPGPPIELVVRDGRRVIARGDLAAGWKQGDVEVPVSALAAQQSGTVCVRNGGSGKIAIAGAPGSNAVARIGATPANGAIRLAYLDRERHSWFGYAPTIADRLTVVRDAFPGSAALWVFGALALGTFTGAVTLVLRVGRGWR